MPEYEVVVTVKCIACKATRDVRAGEIAPDDVPMCDCGSLMVAQGAKRQVKKVTQHGPK